QRPEATVTFFIQEPVGWHPSPRSQLVLDPITADVVKWEPFAGQNMGRRLRAWVRPLHTGEAGGLAGQTIAFLASAGGAMLVWTGIALAWRRFRSWRRRAGPSEAILASEARQEVSAD
ncbi:MAG: PepSY domain-containing protein, partial [Candidatus Rokuibacteriota bacterium]